MRVVGLRERKKLETRRLIADSARQLALQRGVEGFTVDEVAELADVSPRTFFNYFDCKEAAIIGVDPDWVRELGQRLLDRPRSESPVVALRSVLFDRSDDVAALASSWVARIELVHRHPALMPRHLAATDDMERELAQAMAARLGVDLATDPFPRLVVAAGVATARATMSWWHSHGQPGVLKDHLDNAFAMLGRGMKRP